MIIQGFQIRIYYIPIIYQSLLRCLGYNIDDLVFLSFVTFVLSGYPNSNFPCCVLYCQSVVPHTKVLVSACMTVLKKKIIKITLLFLHLSSKVLIIFNTICIRLFRIILSFIIVIDILCCF